MRAPPDDRVGRVHQVEHPGAVPRLAGRWDAGAGVVREPHGPAALVDGLRLWTAGVAVVAELTEEGVEVGRPCKQGAGGAVAQVVLATERGLAAKGSQALACHVQLRPRVVGSFDQRS